jgi:hypothetical protein
VKSTASFESLGKQDGSDKLVGRYESVMHFWLTALLPLPPDWIIFRSDPAIIHPPFGCLWVVAVHSSL